MKKILLSLLLSVLALGAFAQGVTTSSMTGTVRDVNGEVLPGATIIAVHTPTGAQYGNASNTEGRFRLANMNVGGPYKVTISFVGYDDYVQEGVFLTLGQTLNLNIAMKETANQLDAIEVVARKDDIFDGTRTGVQTVVGEQRILETPTVSRAIADFARLEPTATVTDGNDGFSISIAGQNNRYNAIYIDGAVNNDVFGLAGSGTNGGQTGVSPISIDAIEQFNISVAPFDVRQSGFAGGSINAVTRSGSNNFEGSAYYFWQNEKLVGKTPRESDDDSERTRLDEFSAQTYGFRLGGPIIKNKLFFFGSVEFQRDENPFPFDFNTYQGDAGDAEINALLAKLNGFGYDPGTFTNNRGKLDSDKFLFRIDYNINQNHKLTLRHSYTSADNVERTQSGTRFLEFQNNAESFLSTTNSSALELKSNFGNNFSNKLVLGLTIVRDDRDPTGQPFPQVQISDGGGTIEFGSEPFSTANRLDQDIFTITNDFEIYAGKHTLTIGTHNEFYKVLNLFIARNFGDYNFASLSDFLNDQQPTDFDRNFSLVDNIAGDESAAAAVFNSGLLGFYIQDDFQVSDRFKLAMGLRLDIPFFEDTPANDDFNNRSTSLLQQYYDLQGAQTGEFIKSQVLFAPRVGFNWDIFGDQTLQLRGGVGIFTSRVPLVWPGGAYNNYGFNVGAVGNASNVPTFNPDPFNQPPGAQDVSNPSPSGFIDLFADGFKVPQVLKTDIAVDYQLPWGMIATLEFLYTKNINGVFYQNLNIRPSTQTLTGGPDDRPIYNRRDPIDPTYLGIYLASNDSRGHAYNLVAQLQKPFDNGLSFALSYNYGDAFGIYEGTSSQNSSQWRGLHSILGRNTANQVQRTTFAGGHRVLATASYRIDYPKDGQIGGATQISLIYNGQSGNPFSYIYNDNGGLTNEDSRERNLIYIPSSRADVNLIADGGRTAEIQWAELNRFIESDPYLRTRRGQYAERNGSFAPFNSVVDLRLLQDVYIGVGNGQKNILQFSLDIFNFSNLLNKRWGRIRTTGDVQLLNFEGFEADGTTPQFTFDGIEDDNIFKGSFDDAGVRSSRWRIQMGVRYIFQ